MYFEHVFVPKHAQLDRASVFQREKGENCTKKVVRGEVNSIL